MKRINQVSRKGFTLIELLIVIAILGVLAAGVLIAVDPVDRINSANDAKVQNDVGVLGRAAEAYAARNNGLYPGPNAIIAVTGDLATDGDVKTPPSAPSGYTAYQVTVPAGCTTGGGPACTSFILTGQLKSKKYTQAPAPGPYTCWRYESMTGKACITTTANCNLTSNVCP